MSRSRRVVFVADDLGVSAGTNAGIARAAEAGLVREASLCVTGAAVAEGAALARELGIGVGLHLSLTLGRARTGPLRGLTAADGTFRSLGAVLRSCLLRRPDPAAVAREVAAQLAALRDLGIAPTHLNGHHHVHVFPVVRDVVFDAAARAGVRWTRIPDEQPCAGARWSPARLLLSRLGRRAAPLAGGAGLGWLPFIGLATENRTDFAARLQAIATRLPHGDHEWMVHPRLPDAEAERLDPRGAGRGAAAAAELAALSEPGLTVADLSPCRYADLTTAPMPQN